MKTIFDQTTREEIIERIKKLNNNSAAHWGKMNVYQMIKHCSVWEEMLAGKKQYKQGLIGKLFGEIALKSMMKDEAIKHNLPTAPGFKITDSGDVEAGKAEWIALIMENASNKSEGFMHPFFGKITLEQAGIMDYKHTDHHLRQFGC